MIETRLTAIAVAIFTFIGSVVSTSAAPNHYRGKVGRWEATFSLNWGADDQVTGTYQYPNRRGVVYTLRGNNFTEGELYLEEFTGRELSAKCHLKKEVVNGEIVWAGKMHNADGRTLDMFFARALNKTPAGGVMKIPKVESNVAQIKDDDSYLGRIGDQTYQTQVTWNEGGDRTNVTFKSESGATLNFSGSNLEEECITLDLMSDDPSIKNEALLRKRIENGAAIWEGTYLVESGERFPIAFGRGLQQNLVSLPPVKAENLPTIKTTKVAALTPWAASSERSEPVKLTPLPNDIVHSYRARVTSTSYDDQKLFAAFKINHLADYYSFDKQDFTIVVPSRENVVLYVEYKHGRNPFKVGDECSIKFDKEGKIRAIELTTIAITHWRQLANGMIEVRGIEDSPDFCRDTDIEPGQSKTLTFLPDKLALNLNTFEPIYWRGVVFTKSQGLVIKKWTPEPGELSINEISVNEDEETPWISVKDNSGSTAIPSSQKTIDAG